MDLSRHAVFAPGALALVLVLADALLSPAPNAGVDYGFVGWLVGLQLLLLAVVYGSRYLGRAVGRIRASVDPESE